MSQADADVWIDRGHELLQLQLRVAGQGTAVAATGADYLQRWMLLMRRARVGLLPVKVQTPESEVAINDYLAAGAVQYLQCQINIRIGINRGPHLRRLVN